MSDIESCDIIAVSCDNFVIYTLSGEAPSRRECITVCPLGYTLSGEARPPEGNALRCAL